MTSNQADLAHYPAVVSRLGCGKIKSGEAEAASSFVGSTAAWSHSSFSDRMAAKYSSTFGGLIKYTEI